MLVVHGLSAFLIPPEHGALAGTAIDAVDVVHFPAFQILIRLRAAPGMNVQGVMAQRQFDVIGAGGADAAKGTDSVQGLVDCQHPGDAALGGDLIDDVSLSVAKLRLSLFQIVQHHSHRTVPLIFRLLSTDSFPPVRQAPVPLPAPVSQWVPLPQGAPDQGPVPPFCHSLSGPEETPAPAPMLSFSRYPALSCYVNFIIPRRGRTVKGNFAGLRQISGCTIMPVWGILK